MIFSTEVYSGKSCRMLKRMEAAGRRVLAKLVLAGFQPDRVRKKIPEGVKLKRILLMRWDAIGDMMVCLPYFRKIRELFPEAEIGIVVSKRNLPLLKYEDGFHTILYDKRPAAYARSLMLARRFNPDVIVDTRMHYDSTTSFIYGVISGAQWRLSASNRDNRLPFSVRVPIPEGKHHIADLIRILLEGLGKTIDDSELDRKPRLSSKEINHAGDFWRIHGFHLKKKTIGVNISAGNPVRRWTAEKTKGLCRMILEHGNVPVIFSASQDRNEARMIAETVTGAIPAPECPTILYVAALLKDIRMMITPDTALVHIAAAYGVPVLGLFPQRESHMPLWFPWRIAFELVRTRSGLVRDIELNEVISAYEKLDRKIP